MLERSFSMRFCIEIIFESSNFIFTSNTKSQGFLTFICAFLSFIIPLYRSIIAYIYSEKNFNIPDNIRNKIDIKLLDTKLGAINISKKIDMKEKYLFILHWSNKYPERIRNTKNGYLFFNIIKKEDCFTSDKKILSSAKDQVVKVRNLSLASFFNFVSLSSNIANYIHIFAQRLILRLILEYPIIKNVDHESKSYSLNLNSIIRLACAVCRLSTTRTQIRIQDVIVASLITNVSSKGL